MMFLLETHRKMRNLGVIFDARLTFASFVLSTVKASLHHFRNIARLRPMLNFSVTEKLMNSFVVSRIDYCSALLSRVSKSTLNNLQYVQNSGSRVLTGTRPCDQISPGLESLHWWGFVSILNYDADIQSITSWLGSSLFIHSVNPLHPQSQTVFFSLMCWLLHKPALDLWEEAFLLFETLFLLRAFACWCLLCILFLVLCTAYFVSSALRSCL